MLFMICLNKYERIFFQKQKLSIKIYFINILLFSEGKTRKMFQLYYKLCGFSALIKLVNQI